MKAVTGDLGAFEGIGNTFHKVWPLLSAVSITEVRETKPTNGSQHSDTQTANPMDEPGSMFSGGAVRVLFSGTG